MTHDYGPHLEPTETPMTTVTLGSLPRGNVQRYGPYREFQIPVPEIILAQRRAMNQIAYEAAQRRRAS